MSKTLGPKLNSFFRGEIHTDRFDFETGQAYVIIKDVKKLHAHKEMPGSLIPEQDKNARAIVINHYKKLGFEQLEKEELGFLKERTITYLGYTYNPFKRELIVDGRNC